MREGFSLPAPWGDRKRRKDSLQGKLRQHMPTISNITSAEKFFCL